MTVKSSNFIRNLTFCATAYYRPQARYFRQFTVNLYRKSLRNLTFLRKCNISERTCISTCFYKLLVSSYRHGNYKGLKPIYIVNQALISQKSYICVPKCEFLRAPRNVRVSTKLHLSDTFASKWPAPYSFAMLRYRYGDLQANPLLIDCKKANIVPKFDFLCNYLLPAIGTVIQVVYSH